MSRQEIVEGYLDGQMSRRVFVRRLVATGVTAASALSYASVLDADPAAAGSEDYYLAILDNQFDGVPVRLQQGQAFYFANLGTSGHDVQDTHNLGLVSTGPLNHYQQSDHRTPQGAGTFRFECVETHLLPMVGAVKVPILVTPASGRLGTAFTIRWSHGRAPEGFVFDVQRKKPGQANFTAWRTGVKAASARFNPGARGRYAFRARVRKPGSGKSDWSAAKVIRVT